jgi:pimeloyl-ACP methyl ester carboxylesterase
MDTTTIVKGAFSLLGEIAPQTMAGVALRLFTKPQRFAAPPRERPFRDDAERSMVDTPVGPVSVLTWSTAELPWEPRHAPRGTVLLMHGWQGRGSQLCAFVEPLLALGFRVVAFDSPAHGDSPGDTADALVFSIALRAVADHCGDVRVVIAHSMGGAATNVALGDGLDVDAVVLLAPPYTVDLVTDDFASQLRLTPRTRRALRREIAKRFHVYAWNRLGKAPVGGRANVAPTLIVHDEDDDEVPFVRGEALANAWPGARLHVTRGLGHRRILRDPDVVSHVCAFIDGHVTVS